MAQEGVVLDIDAKFLDNLKQADKALSSAAKQANELTKQFQKTLTGSKGFSTQMQQIYAGLAKIGGIDFSKGFAQINTSARTSADAVNLLTMNIQKLQGEYKVMAANLSGAKNRGTHLRITDEADLTNINKLRTALAQISESLSKKRKKSLSLIDIESLNRQKDLYKRALKELMSTDSQRTQSVINETNKRIKAAQREVKEIQLSADARYTKTPSSAMSYAKSAKSLNEMTKAVKYLETVRDRLNSKTKTGAANIEKINNLIQKLRDRIREVRGETDKTFTSIDSLVPMLQTMFSLQAIRGYVNELARVRGEFEMQQRSLQVLLKNRNEANKLWSQTVELAIRSPFQVKELVTYNKQLAAYRIESNKIFDTMKRLADISSGLGVDMQRLILAFGQVKAANFLKGCLGYDTPILLYNGEIKKVQDIKVGDTLINEKGEAVHVLELIRGRETMFLVEQVTGVNRVSYRVNRNHILTLWNVQNQRIEDVYVYDYLKNTEAYLGYRIVGGKAYFYDIEVTKDRIDNYYGFVLDGNKRFRLGDGTVTHNTELRQFTEAGVNLLDELAQYYTAIEGRSVAVSEVFDRISKRMVSFTDVEAVIKSMTDAGGTFYQMQEQQADTLRGRISNLKDQLDLMLNEIGEKNDGILKGLVGFFGTLISNWEAILPILGYLSAGFLAMNVSMLKAALGSKALSAAMTSLKSTLINPWTAALFVISEVVAAIWRYNYAIKQIEKDTERLNSSVREISVSFRDAFSTKNIEEARSRLMSLIDLAKNEFNIDVGLNAEDLNNLDLSGLEQKFVELRGVLFDANAIAADFQKTLTQNDSFVGWLKRLITNFGLTEAGMMEDIVPVGSLSSYLEDATKAATDLRMQLFKEANKLGYELNLDADSDLRRPQAVDESDLQYIERLTNAYKALGEEAQKAGVNSQAMQKLISGLEKSTSLVYGSSVDVIENLRDKIANMSSEKATEYAKAAIDKTAITEQWDDIQRELIYRAANLRLGVNIVPTFNLDDGKTTDINGDDKDKKPKDTSWQDLLRVIQEVNKAYKDLTKTFDETTARTALMEKYTDALNDVLSKVKINGQMLSASDFMELFDITGEEGMVAALDQIIKDAPKAADKLKARLAKADVTWEVKIKAKEDSDERLRREMEELFSGYELSLELEKLNIPKDMAQKFFGVDALSLDELGKKVREAEPRFKGTGQEAEYQKLIARINEMERKAQQERTKTYLQYTRDAIGERAKIKLEELRKLQEIELTFAEDTEEKRAAIRKVQEDSYQATQKQAWRDFQKSDIFINLFNDLDMASQELVEHTISQLEEFKSQWSDMPVDEMKEVVNRINQLRSQMAKIQPFGQDFRDVLNRVRNNGRSREELESENIQQTLSISANKEYISELETILRLREEGNEAAEIMATLELKNVDIVGMSTGDIRRTLELKRDEIKVSEDIIEKNRQNINDQALLNEYYEAQLSVINEIEQEVLRLLNSFKGLHDVLADDGGVSGIFIDMGISLTESVFESVKLIEQLKQAQNAATAFGAALNTAMGVIGLISTVVSVISSVFSAIFNAKDKRLEKKIERIQDSIDTLDKSLQRLEESLDNAFSASGLTNYSQQAVENIDQMIEGYEQMIALEQDKKKTDDDAIKSYRESIEDLEERRQEIYDKVYSQSSADILSDAISSAEAFVDAWLEAFRETGDGLSGLEGEFEEMMENLVKRQAALQIVGAYTDMWNQQLKQYLNAEAGDTTLTAAEAAEWADRVKSTFPELSAALESLYNQFGDLVGNEGTLSDLSANIQGITENTAQALEALLNSIRFYTADSNLRLRNIEAVFNSEDMTRNPILNELQQHTTLLRSLESMFTSVIGRGNSTHTGAYLKVSL